MSNPSDTATGAAPAPLSPAHAGLHTPLPGTWRRLDDLRVNTGHAELDEALRARVQRAKDAAGVHADRSVWVSTDAPGVLSLTARPEFTMAPAIGTSPEAVLAVTRKLLAHRSHPGIDKAATVPTRDSLALLVVPPGTGPASEMSIDAFVPRPGSKAVVWAHLTVPLQASPPTMLAVVADAVGAWHFSSP